MKKDKTKNFGLSIVLNPDRAPLYFHVKKKPCLNDRDTNPKPLDKDRDTIPMGLEEQSSRRPGQ